MLKRKIWENIILFGCLSITFYFARIQFIRYSENEDNSILSYREHELNSESKDRYPTYTVCIEYSSKNPWNFSNLMILSRCDQRYVCTYYYRDRLPLSTSLQFQGEKHELFYGKQCFLLILILN